MPVPRSWYANLRANPGLTVHLKHGVRADLSATVVPADDETRQRVIPAIVALQDQSGLSIRVTRQNLDDWLARSPLVEIVFDDKELMAAAADLP